MIVDKIYDIITNQDLDARVHLMMDKAALELSDKGLLNHVITNYNNIEGRINSQKNNFPMDNLLKSYQNHILAGVYYRAQHPQMINNASSRAAIVGYKPPISDCQKLEYISMPQLRYASG